MAVIQWKTKTELQAGALSGTAVILGTEDYPTLSIFQQKVRSADVNMDVDPTVYNLISYVVPVANQFPGDSTIYNLISYVVPVANQFPEDPTVYNLISYVVPVANQFPCQGDLVGFLTKGNCYTVASDMKITTNVPMSLVGFLSKGNIYTISSSMKVTWKV